MKNLVKLICYKNYNKNKIHRLKLTGIIKIFIHTLKYFAFSESKSINIGCPPSYGTD